MSQSPNPASTSSRPAYLLAPLAPVVETKMMTQVLYGEVNVQRTRKGTLAINLVTPHVECPSQQECYRFCFSKGQLRDILKMAPEDGVCEVIDVRVEHLKEGDKLGIDEEPAPKTRKKKRRQRGTKRPRPSPPSKNKRGTTTTTADLAGFPSFKRARKCIDASA